MYLANTVHAPAEKALAGAQAFSTRNRAQPQVVTKNRAQSQVVKEIEKNEESVTQRQLIHISDGDADIESDLELPEDRLALVSDTSDEDETNTHTAPTKTGLADVFSKILSKKTSQKGSAILAKGQTDKDILEQKRKKRKQEAEKQDDDQKTKRAKADDDDDDDSDRERDREQRLKVKAKTTCSSKIKQLVLVRTHCIK